MTKIGFIDDEDTNYRDYAKRLRRYDIELYLYEGESSAEKIIDWIIENDLLCVLVDFDLSKKYSHNGTDLVFAINQVLPDFPCIMLTNYPEQSKNEKLVPYRLIWDREKMNEADLSEVVTPIKEEIEVFLKRKDAIYAEYAALLEKRRQASLSVVEEERFCQLHTIFSRYGETDDIPAQLLSSDTNAKLDKLIESMSKLLEKEGK